MELLGKLASPMSLNCYERKAFIRRFGITQTLRGYFIYDPKISGIEVERISKTSDTFGARSACSAHKCFQLFTIFVSGQGINI